MQPHHPDRPRERVPDDGSKRTNQSDQQNDRHDDRRTQTRHPDDDRLTEADLDEHERERDGQQRSTHAQM